MNNIFKSLLTVLLLLITPLLFAQEEVQMADAMRSEGKIYVVVAILLVLVLGLILYVFMMDKKITSLEQKINKKG